MIHLLLGAAFVVGGCVGSFVETTPLNSPPHPLAPRPPRSVEVYTSSPPARPHVDVALLRASRSNFADANTQRMVQLLRERASALGCDALFVSDATERAGNPDVFDPGSHALSGTCIAYLPQSAGVPAAPTSSANAIVLVPEQAPKPEPAAVIDAVSTGKARR